MDSLLALQQYDDADETDQPQPQPPQCDPRDSLLPPPKRARKERQRARTDAAATASSPRLQLPTPDFGAASASTSVASARAPGLRLRSDHYSTFAPSAVTSAAAASASSAAPLPAQAAAAASTAHGGRIRSFPHVDGAWAAHIFLPLSFPTCGACANSSPDAICPRSQAAFERRAAEAELEATREMEKQAASAVEEGKEALDGARTAVAWTKYTVSIPLGPAEEGMLTRPAAAAASSAASPSAAAVAAAASASSAAASSAASASSLVHVSLSRTFVLRYDQISDFVAAVREVLSGVLAVSPPLHLAFQEAKLYWNEEQTRAFAALRVWPTTMTEADSNHDIAAAASKPSDSAPGGAVDRAAASSQPPVSAPCGAVDRTAAASAHATLLELITRVDSALAEFGLRGYYDPPEPHATVAWTLPPKRTKRATSSSELASAASLSTSASPLHPHSPASQSAIAYISALAIGSTRCHSSSTRELAIGWMRRADGADCGGFTCILTSASAVDSLWLTSHVRQGETTERVSHSAVRSLPTLFPVLHRAALVPISHPAAAAAAPNASAASSSSSSQLASSAAGAGTSSGKLNRKRRLGEEQADDGNALPSSNTASAAAARVPSSSQTRARRDPLSSAPQLANAEFHCVLSFLSLSDIGHCQQVSRPWNQVTSQLSAQFLLSRGCHLVVHVTRASLDRLLSSPLCRGLVHRLVVFVPDGTHPDVEVIEDMCRSYDGNDAWQELQPEQPREADPNAINAQQMRRIADLMPQLHHLLCKLPTEPVSPALQYRFPPALRTLEIAPIDHTRVFTLLRRVLEGASVLQSLELISIWIRGDPWNHRPRCGPVRHLHPKDLIAPVDLFASLQAAGSSLRTLRIQRDFGDLAWKHEHIRSLLSLPQLTVFDIGFEWTTESLHVLTSEGSAHARLKDIGVHSICSDVTSADASVLCKLTNLEVLDVQDINVEDASFFATMTRLTKVGVGCDNANELIQALRHCTNITSLHIDCQQLTGAHLAELLPVLPRLHTLILSNAFRVDDLRSLLLVPELRVFRMPVNNCRGNLLLTDDLHLAPLRQLSRLEELDIHFSAKFSSVKSGKQFRMDSDPKSKHFRADWWPHIKRQAQ